MNYLYASQSVTTRRQIFRETADVIGDNSRLEMYHDIETFSGRLRRFNNPEIIILLAAVKAELRDFVSIRHLLLDAAVILLVPDGQADTISSAHLLRPKFLGRLDSDLDKIVLIVQKLREKKQR